MYWYNNALAEGSQAYPRGLHKYYDMFSFRGWAMYWADWRLAKIEKFLQDVSVLWNTFSIFLMNQPIDVLLQFFYKDTSNTNVFLFILYLELIDPFGITEIVFNNCKIPLERGFEMG